MAKAKYWKLPGGRYGGITSRGKRFIVKSLSAAKTKLGKAVKRKGKTRKSTRTRTSNPKKTTKKVRRMVRRYRRKRRKGGKSMTRTAFKLIRLGALVGGGAAEASQYSSMEDKLIGGLVSYGGYHWGEKRFQWQVAARVWTPYLVACLFTHGIPKITSIIRRL